MSITATAATPPPPTPQRNGLPPALPTGQVPMQAAPGSIASRFPVKAIVGGLLGAGLGFLLLGPLGALALGAVGAFIGARMSASTPPRN
ncbi:MAG: hypothetical protein JWM98_2872 [Thermoleophilia bacterium]|nr:hypothetical protein [Thermoleophilia bacterium]